MSKTKLTWALEAASKGMAVFPLHWTDDDGNCSCGNTEPGHRAGKHPLAGDGFAPKGVLDASLDPNQIKKWWGAAPKANIGAHPGEEVVVIDLDRKKGVDGVQTLCDHLGVDFWELEGETFTVETPTTGKHLYYKTSEIRGNAVGILEGVDVRALNGYVLAPGSMIGGKLYKITSDVPMADVGPELAEMLSGPRQRAENADTALYELDTRTSLDSACEYLKVREPAIEGQGGDAHTFATAVRVRDYGVSEDACYGLLIAEGGWNDRCDPPWDLAELEIKVRNAYRYAKDRAGTKGGGILEMFQGGSTIEDMLGIEVQDVKDIEFEDPTQDAEDRKTKFRKMFNSSFFDGGEAIINRESQVEYVIDNWLLTEGLTLLLAKRGVGKSTVLLDMGARMSCDMDWHGEFMDEGWDVIYLCGEDDAGATDHFRAWCKHHEDMPKKGRFRLFDIIPNVIDENLMTLWTEALVELTAGRRCVVMLDTWQRATAGASQNDDKDMQMAITQAERLAKALSGPVIAAVHPPKHDSEVMMGSSTIENSSKAIWKLTETATHRKMEVTRIKGEGVGKHNLFTFHQEGLDTFKKSGKENTGLVPILQGGSAKAETAERKEVQMSAFYFVIGQLDADRKAEHPESKPFSISTAADRIEEISRLAQEVGEDERITDDALWAKEMIDALSHANIESFSRTQMIKTLKEMFIDDSRGYEGNDGMKLVAEKTGKYHRFVFKPSGL